MDDDAFINQYEPSELRIASEFLTRWLPFLSKDLCLNCTKTLTNRISSLASGNTEFKLLNEDDCNGNCENSIKIRDADVTDTNSLGSWKDMAKSVDEISANGFSAEPALAETPSPRISWADMAQEDELEEEEYELSKRIVNNGNGKPLLSREQREHIRFLNVKRKKDFIAFERVGGKLVNIVEGLELHTGVFSAAEQKRIVDYVGLLEEMGRKAELEERTFTAPRKWMKGKGRKTIQFGCCYNYATDKKGNPPGILKDGIVDPMPDLFKVIIRRLVKWHVLPPECVPDSCIVNIYEKDDCIPPHIDHHDFVRPFCTVSFLSECNILFGTMLKSVIAGEFSGTFDIALPVGSVLVLQGNGADVAKHCVPAVHAKRISITFRKMDESKRPQGFIPEPDLQGIVPLSYEAEKKTDGLLPSPKSEPHSRSQQHSRGAPSPRGNGRVQQPARTYAEKHYTPRSGSPRRERVEQARTYYAEGQYNNNNNTRSEPRSQTRNNRQGTANSYPQGNLPLSYEAEKKTDGLLTSPKSEPPSRNQQYNRRASSPRGDDRVEGSASPRRGRVEPARTYVERQYNNNNYQSEARFRTQNNRRGSTNSYYVAKINRSG
ncbi:hypothetical protein ACFE04_023743 [Oxalis oulophora]